jgi:hypothetical protein
VPKLVEYQAEGDPVLVLTKAPGEDVVAVGNLEDAIAKVEVSLRDQFRVIRRIADEFAAVIQGEGSPVDSAEIEFGLEASGKGTIYVVETTGTATFKVKLTLTPTR